MENKQITESEVFELIKKKLNLDKLQKKRWFNDVSECWESTPQTINKSYYPITKYKKKRVMWKTIVCELFFKEEKKEGSQVWLECCNPWCVNPAHLWITQKYETVFMHSIGDLYWKRRNFFKRVGRLPLETKKPITLKKNFKKKVERKKTVIRRKITGEQMRITS